MKTLSLLIKSASSLCNLRCRYCFYANISSLREVRSFGVMQQEVAQKMVENVLLDLENGDDITFAFQGGEPTMAGLAWFEHFVQIVAQVLAAQAKTLTLHYALQTNGIVLDDAWCAFLAKHNFLVGLSLDGEASFHDENRVDAQGKGTYARVMAAKRCLEKYHVEYNVLWVLTNHHARYPQKVWRFLCENNIQYVQFVPCLDDLDAEKPSPHALEPKRFASFYTQLFALWAADLEKGQYRSVKFFDDLFNLLTKRIVTACGFTGQCQPQYVVEADGSVYPCDFYVLDAWRTGSFVTQTPAQLRETPAMQRFLARPRTEGKLCSACRWRSFCGGGCVRMKHSMYLDRAETYCGYQAFLNENAQQIEFVAQHYLR